MTEKIFDIITNLKDRCLDKEESIQREYMLSPAEYSAMLALVPSEIYSCNELSKVMNLSVSRISRILDRLIKNGFLKEVKNKEDRRVLNVKLTDKGTDIRNKIRNKLDECEKDILSKLHKSELYLLENTLNKISSVFISS